MRTIKYVSLLLISLVLWAVFIVYGISEGFLLRSIAGDETPEAFVEAAKGMIKNEFVGNLAMVLVEDGKVSKDFYHSIDQTIDEHTVYQLASVSKWVSAWGIFTLVEKGKLDIDKPIDDYLTRWHLPESEFNNRQVTIRRLLSHTAGLVDDLGYAGFEPGETVQTIEESLIKAADGYYSEGVARVGYEPGSKYMYSGAGYTILQLIIEEVSGQSFQNYMTEAVFKPLQMNHSTFVLPDTLDWQLATRFVSDSSISPPNKFTALAAASLYSCPADLSKFLIANVSKNQVLKQETIQLMSVPEAFINSTKVYGLGPHLYSQKDESSNVIGHDGSGGSPTINTTARIDLMSKDGIIVLEMGSPDIASAIADEWLFQKIGVADYVVIQRNKTYLGTLFIGGFLVLIFLFIFFFVKRSRLKSVNVE